MAARPAKRLKRAFSTSEVMNDEQKRKTPPKKTVTFGRKGKHCWQKEGYFVYASSRIDC